MAGCARATARMAIVGALTILVGCTTADGSSEPSTGSTTRQQLPSMSFAPTPDSSATGQCLGPVSYPNLPAWELNALLPVGEVAEDYVQVEYAMDRGGGLCETTTSSDAVLLNACAVLSGESQNTIDLMLGTTTDAITEGEFAGGARAMVTELVSGKLSDGVSSFQYRMTAYSYSLQGEARGSALLDRVASCKGVRDMSGAGDRRYVAVDQGDTHLVATHFGTTVVLIEVIDQLGADGSRRTIPTTASGRLPTEAVLVIEDWWIPRVSEFFAKKSPAA